MLQQKISESQFKDIRKNLEPAEVRILKNIYHNEVVPKREVYKIVTDVIMDKPYISPLYAKLAILDLLEKNLVTLKQSDPKELNLNDIVEITKEGMDLCMLTDLRIE